MAITIDYGNGEMETYVLGFTYQWVWDHLRAELKAYDFVDWLPTIRPEDIVCGHAVDGLTFIEQKLLDYQLRPVLKDQKNAA